MTTVTVSSKFQVVIPRKVRQRLKLKPGQKLAVVEKDRVVHLIPLLPLKKLKETVDDILDSHFASKSSRASKWPRAPSPRNLTPEQRVNMAIEMSSVMGDLVLDSIRDQNPGISERELLNKARKRIYAGRRGR